MKHSTKLGSNSNASDCFQATGFAVTVETDRQNIISIVVGIFLRNT